MQTRIEDKHIRRAALYIRVSSEEQAMHGLSLQAQRETLTAYAKENGLSVVGLYADEGVTARKKYRNRAQFMRMLRDVESGNIDVILFIKLDRWFRSIADYYEVQRILDAHNVVWIATEEQYDTTTANGRLHLNIKLSIAQDESDRTSERIKFVFDSKVRRGEVISGKAPLGYKIENKRLVPDPETIGVAQDIFNKYLDISSISSLRKYVMDTYGIVHSHTAYRVMLTNERYIGRAHGQDDFCEPIIDPNTFSRVQKMIQIRAQRHDLTRSDRVYLFTGLVFCAECGRRLSAHTVDKYIYYRCTRYEKLHSCPHKKRTSELRLESWLQDHLIDCFRAYNSKIESDRSHPQVHIDEARIRRKMEKLKDLYINDLIERDVYERDFIALRDELQAATNLTPAPEPVDIDFISTLLSAYVSLTREEKKALWVRIVDKIIIDQNDNFSVLPISP